MTRPLAEPPARIVVRGAPPDGFVLEGEDGAGLVAASARDGWTIGTGEGSWRIRREKPGVQHALLEETDRGELRELSRMTAWPDPAGARVPASLLLEDGRLFLIGLAGEPGMSVRLSGWETTGAYWVARPEGAEWTIEATPAGREARIGWDALVLFAVALLPFLEQR